MLNMLIGTFSFLLYNVFQGRNVLKIILKMDSVVKPRSALLQLLCQRTIEGEPLTTGYPWL